MIRNRTEAPTAAGGPRCREDALVALVALLLVGALAVLAAEELSSPGRQRTAQSFQRLVRGVGLGPAVDLSGSALDFDPRLAGHSLLDVGPVPLGSAGRPRSTLSVYPLRHLAAGNRDVGAL